MKEKINILMSKPGYSESEPLEPIYESETGIDGKPKKLLKIEGIAVPCDTVGINNRLYPSKIIDSRAKLFTKTRIAEGRSGSELNHPRVDKDGQGIDGSIFEINLKKVCALIEYLKMEGNKLAIKYRVTKSDNGLTTAGDILANLIENGMRPGCSLRGAGSAIAHPDGYQMIADDYRLITVDVVGNPSFDSEAMLDVTYEAAKSGQILTESIDGEQNRLFVEQASEEFIRQVNKNASVWSGRKELNKTVLLEYLSNIM